MRWTAECSDVRMRSVPLASLPIRQQCRFLVNREMPTEFVRTRVCEFGPGLCVLVPLGEHGRLVEATFRNWRGGDALSQDRARRSSKENYVIRRCLDDSRRTVGRVRVTTEDE
jgi:hypothetical protein